ncbi:MAG: toxic anion resistance protein, partial [Clostridia bacterium]|nr:toxic anion resistance protein [Clostridia bacterium]
LYDVNLANYKELTLYIIAGRNKLNRAREHDLAEMLRHAEETGLPEDAQAANDFSSLCDRFDKRLHDLELTRTVALQMAPQIRMIQSNDTVMTEKLQSTLVNTIPLWKSQMVISLGLAHSKSALDAQRAVNDVTNELLRKNAEALKIATVETAKEAERGVVDIDTLKYTNEMLISTLSEVLTIRKEGAERRKNAEIELGRMDEELRTKLLTID